MSPAFEGKLGGRFHPLDSWLLWIPAGSQSCLWLLSGSPPGVPCPRVPLRPCSSLFVPCTPCFPEPQRLLPGKGPPASQQGQLSAGTSWESTVGWEQAKTAAFQVAGTSTRPDTYKGPGDCVTVQNGLPGSWGVLRLPLACREEKEAIDKFLGSPVLLPGLGWQ